MNNQLTRSDIKKMEDEINYRKVVKRYELLEAVKEARAQGDLSENFEYYAAKREKNRNESRIRYLERMVKTAEIVDDSSSEDEVGINNTVVIYIPEDDEEEKVRIVTTVRGDALNGLISIESPMGKALLKKKVGDAVTINTETGYSYDVVIKEIIKTSDDSKDEIRQF